MLWCIGVKMLNMFLIHVLPNYSEALDMYYGVAILRVPQGLDYSQIVEDEDTPVVMNGNETTGAAVAEEIKRNQSAGQLSQGKDSLSSWYFQVMPLRCT